MIIAEDFSEKILLTIRKHKLKKDQLIRDSKRKMGGINIKIVYIIE